MTYSLKKTEKSLLSKLLMQSLNNDNQVSISSFRKSNLELIEIIDQLILEDLVRIDPENTFYSLSLNGLYLTDTQTSKDIFNNIDQVTLLLRDCYKKSETGDDPVYLSYIEDQIKINRSDLVTCLKYLKHGAAMQSSTDLYTQDAFIIPSESLFTFTSFFEKTASIINFKKPRKPKLSDSDKNNETHGNSQVFSDKRELVLGAALAIISKYQNQCVSKDGNLKGSKIAKLIIKHQKTLFSDGNGCPPMSERVMSDKISFWLNLLKNTET